MFDNTSLLFCSISTFKIFLEIQALESNNHDRSKMQEINLSFRECVRNCVKGNIKIIFKCRPILIKKICI